MSTETIEQLDFEKLVINESSIYSEGGSLFFVAEALTDHFVPQDVMERDAWTFKGKELRFRHEQPEKNVNSLIGHIHDSWFEDGKIKQLAEVWGYREDLKKLQNEIKSGKMSISAGYKKTKSDDGDIIGIYGRELSVTPFPKCTQELGCSIVNVIEQNEDENTMGENEESDRQSRLEESVIAQNEERGERIVELESTIEAMEERIQTANETISEQSEKIENLETELAKAKETIKLNESLPIRQEIVTLLEITDEEEKKKKLDELLELNEKQLKSKKEDLVRAIKIAQKRSRSSPITGEGIEENDIDKLSPEEMALRMNPNLKKFMKKGNQPNPAPRGYDNQGDVPFIS